MTVVDLVWLVILGVYNGVVLGCMCSIVEKCLVEPPKQFFDENILKITKNREFK